MRGLRFSPFFFFLLHWLSEGRRKRERGASGEFAQLCVYMNARYEEEGYIYEEDAYAGE